MKNRSRIFRIVGAAALLISMLAATVAPAAAQDDDDLSQDWLATLIDLDGAGFLEGNNSIYYPWVSNGENFGLGASQTSISIQNLEDRDTTISIYVGNAAGDFDLVTSAYLSAYASKTFSAGQLGIAEGSGAPVAVVSFNNVALASYPGLPAGLLGAVPATTVALAETPIILSNPVADDEDDGENDGGDFTQVIACVVNYHLAASPNLGNPWGYVAAEDHVFDGVAYDAGDWVSLVGVTNVQSELQAALNAVNDSNDDELINPFGGINADGDCFDVIDVVGGTFNNGVAIGGTALQTATEGAPAEDDDDAELEQFVTSHTSTSGYNAVNGAELYYFGEWYLPIVQTNCGPGGCWDSMIRVANFSDLNNAVTIRFFPSDDGSGSLQTGFQLEALVNGGDTWNVNLGDLVPEGWVGTAHILSDGAVFAMVDRYKVGYNMWITNTGSSADFEVDYDGDGDVDMGAQIPNANGRYALLAPHVLMDYFGWNTGINVANLVATDNNISIQYFNMFGNATQVLNQRLAAHGMTYFYDPSIAAQDNNSQDVTTDPNAGVVGSAIIWSEHPVAAAVDATKYPETDPNGGADVFQATSYNATANIFPWQAVPYVTKGNPADGSGATSGINIMNPNAVAANATVYWVNPSGFQADNFGYGNVTIPAFANGFVYTLWQQNLPNGFTGAAQVVSTVPVAAVSANVNYDVDGDGSAMFNAFNPCGLYRVAYPCTFGDTFEPGGQSVTKYYVVDDEDGEDETTISEDAIGIQGINLTLVSTSGTGYEGTGITGTAGSALFTNVPAGTYELYVTGGVPGSFVAPDFDEPVDTFVVAEGEDVVLINELTYAQGVQKTVCVFGEFDEEAYFDAIDDWEDAGADPLEEPMESDFFLCSDTVLEGVNITIYENIGEDFLGGQVAGDIVFDGETDADGTIAANLPVGDYILCMWDEDGVAMTAGADGVAGSADDEEVAVQLPDEIFATIQCAQSLFGFEFEIFGDLFTVEAGVVTELTNVVFLERGTINFFVGTTGATTGLVLQQEGGEGLNPVEGVEVCLAAEWTNYLTNSVYEFDDPECAVTDEDGQVSFDNKLGDQETFFGNGPVETSFSLQGVPVEDRFYTGHYDVTLYSDDYCMTNVYATGNSEVDEEEYVAGCGDDEPETRTVSAELAQATGQAFAGSFHLRYNPTGDVAQDGVLDDSDAGTYDVVIEMSGDNDGLTPVSTEGFEDGEADDWSDEGRGSITVVESGYEGVESSSGDSHAVLSQEGDTSGPFTDFGGYSSEWPENGFITTIDIYLDVNWPENSGFDYSVALNTSGGVHAQDFVFHVKKLTGDDLIVGVSNNSEFAPKTDLESGDHGDIPSTGWYTFQHRFYEDGGNVFVEMTVFDSNGGIVFTDTLPAIDDGAPVEADTDAGGNRYGWFTFIDVGGELHVDNVGLYLVD